MTILVTDLHVAHKTAFTILLFCVPLVDSVNRGKQKAAALSFTFLIVIKSEKLIFKFSLTLEPDNTEECREQQSLFS